MSLTKNQSNNIVQPQKNKHRLKECSICPKILGKHWPDHWKTQHANRIIKERVPGEDLEDPHFIQKTGRFETGNDLSSHRGSNKSVLDNQSEFYTSKRLDGSEGNTFKRQKVDNRAYDDIPIFEQSFENTSVPPQSNLNFPDHSK